MPNERIFLQQSKGVQIQGSNSGKHACLNFKTDKGVVGIAIDYPQLSLLVTMILQHAALEAPKPKGRFETKVAFSDPLPARAVAVGRGPTEKTVTLTIEMGHVLLPYIVNKSALRQVCVDLADGSYLETGWESSGKAS